ncbi:carboxymuconolactone decarboxylase family protein [Rhodoligotrophos ferricapiens]|uniref:carboxymuconolactone decarboxylase family protein n=1 Tax=Rhodoligotrophos ferricapiens TaxID=3069264 RepID=UPI00315D74F1
MKAIEYAEASQEVRAIFDDIKSSRNVPDVNNFWKYLANDPRMLDHVWSSLKDVMGAGGHLDPAVKELIYIAVSITNGCAYCQASHTAAARKKGVSDEMLQELYAIVGLANMTNRLAIAYRVPLDEDPGAAK